MASIYKRPGSPFWWMCWRNPATGNRERFSTKFKVGIGSDLTKARRERDLYSVKETQHHSGRAEEYFERWVPDWFTAKRYTKANEPERVIKTRDESAWIPLSRFLELHQIRHPRELRRDHCFAYRDWRQQGPKKVSFNSVLLELASLGRIMKEAIIREFAETNPVKSLGLKKQEQRLKPEVTDAELGHIRKCLTDVAYLTEVIDKGKTGGVTLRKGHLGKNRFPGRRFIHGETGPGQRMSAEELRRILYWSFEVTIHQGVRVSETWINLKDVNWDRRLLTFYLKGRKTEQREIHPKLFDLLKKLHDSGETHTYQRPAWFGAVSDIWTDFFRAIGLPHLSFHCFRVTAISRMHRGKTEEAIAMKVVGHASTTVHRIYRRIREGELGPVWDLLG